MTILGLVFFVCLSSVVTSQSQVLNIRDNGKICSQWITVQPGTSVSYIPNPECDSSVEFEEQNGKDRLCCQGIPLTTPSSNFPRECGRQKYQPHKNRIVGGFLANKNSWPWQVLLKSKTSQCGGALIDQQHVLTAAHCLEFPIQVQDYKVYIGAHDIDKPMYMEQEITVKKIWAHEQYNGDTIVNDIAVIRLSKPVQISDTVNVICLPGPEVGKTVNQTVWLAGWGRTAPNADSSPILKQTWLYTLGNRCRVYGDFNEDKQICVGRYKIDSASCQGDSGGPLMLESSNGQWFINGVVSFGNACGTTGLPTVHTRVKYFLPWIQNKLKAA